MSKAKKHTFTPPIYKVGDEVRQKISNEPCTVIGATYMLGSNWYEVQFDSKKRLILEEVELVK